jgi:hypothetical protein
MTLARELRTRAQNPVALAEIPSSFTAIDESAPRGIEYPCLSRITC